MNEGLRTTRFNRHRLYHEDDVYQVYYRSQVYLCGRLYQEDQDDEEEQVYHRNQVYQRHQVYHRKRLYQEDQEDHNHV
ncbi:hypothetical protein BGZ90_004932 [Linnemannia elongata]|nr:hypothetical protein BGZ90_004932 [Linnemannia elongata]